MYLKEINLVQFKNIAQRQLEFSPKINCFTGENGVGKTNLLDAIYYLSMTKSYFNHQDQLNIQHDADFFMIEGYFVNLEEETHIYIGLKREQKKIIKKNNKTYTKLTDHIGQFPLVIISPYDQDLINDGSEPRRKLMDAIIGQSNPLYLKQLIQYNKILAQRNALLKYFAQNRTFDELSLQIYDNQMIEVGTIIHNERKKCITEFTELFLPHHQHISQKKENVSIEYKSQLNNTNFETLLEQNIAKDRVLQYSSVGIHKDDLIFSIDNQPIKKFGSQGQQKSFIIALKLAQFDIIKNHLNTKPLLLLDDVFDKLDEKRVGQLIQLVNEDHFGQIFITDTHKERMEHIVNQMKAEHKIIEIKK